MAIATIDSGQDYDVIYTLSYSGITSQKVWFYKNNSMINGTLYYREGTSGSWNSFTTDTGDLSKSFSVSSTTMQVGHNWNKTGDNYMTPSFYDSSGLLKIQISQKAVLSGNLGESFMYNFLGNSIGVEEIDVPDISGVSSVGSSFMRDYAYYGWGLTNLEVPDTSNITSCGSHFMESYAGNCNNLKTLEVPDLSSLSSTGTDFMISYAYNCYSLTSLGLPKVGWFYSHNVDWSVPSGRLGYLKGVVKDPADLADWKYLASASGRTLYTNYIQDPDNVISPQSKANFMTFFNQYL